MNWTENGVTILVDGQAYHIHTLTLVFAAVFLVVAPLALYILFRARRPAPEGCRWRRVKATQDLPLRKWVCRTCGEDGFTSARKPPRECKRPLKATL